MTQKAFRKNISIEYNKLQSAVNRGWSQAARTYSKFFAAYGGAYTSGALFQKHYDCTARKYVGYAPNARDLPTWDLRAAAVIIPRVLIMQPQ